MEPSGVWSHIQQPGWRNQNRYLHAISNLLSTLRNRKDYVVLAGVRQNQLKLLLSDQIGKHAAWKLGLELDIGHSLSCGRWQYMYSSKLIKTIFLQCWYILMPPRDFVASSNVSEKSRFCHYRLTLKYSLKCEPGVPACAHFSEYFIM